MTLIKTVRGRVLAGVLTAVALACAGRFMLVEDAPLRIDPSRLSSAFTVEKVSGTGSRVLYVFESSDCSYCRKLQAEIDKLEDVTIRLVVLPGHTDLSRAHAQTVACSGSPYETWRTHLQSQEAPLGEPCQSDQPKQNRELALALGVTRTPTLVRADGESMEGWSSAEEIQKWAAAQ